MLDEALRLTVSSITYSDSVSAAADVCSVAVFLASNGAAHDEAVKRLKPLLTEFGHMRVKTSRKAST